jgi:type II secretory pathway pseudopilin PulG
MVVVAIIGILASVAIPSFNKLLLRAKTAERTVVMRTIVRNIQDLYVQNGSIPGGFILGNYNPAWPPTSERRVLDRTQAGWKTVFRPGDEIEGAVYYTYYFWVLDVPGLSQIFVRAVGDLDGDGTQAFKDMWYTRTNGIYLLSSEWPPEGAEETQGF